MLASEQRKKWQRSLANQFPLLADLLGQWAGDRHGQAVGLFDTLQLPPEELHWGYLWLDLCALARHGSRAPGGHPAQMGSLPRAGCRAPPPVDGLLSGSAAAVAGAGAQQPPLQQLRAASGEQEADEQDTEDKTPASASWLNWLQGLGRASGVRKPQERLVWLLHAEGPELECKIRSRAPRGVDCWAPGRSTLLSTQYANLLDEEDWALVRTLPRTLGRLPREVWAPLANHSRLFNARGQKLQLAITAPLLQIVATEQGMSAVLSPAAAARGAHILPLAQDLWQLILTPQPLLDRLPALEAIPLLPAEGLAELQHTLDAIVGLPWHSQVAGLHGNAELAPWPGVASVQLDWQDGQLAVRLVTRFDDLPPQPLARAKPSCARGSGLSLLAAGSGGRERRGPAAAQSVAHRVAWQRVAPRGRAGTGAGQCPAGAGGCRRGHSLASGQRASEEPR